MKTPLACLGSMGVALMMNACTSVTPYVNTGLKNSCLPEAMIMQSALGRESIRSKLLLMRYNNGNREVGHVVVVFCYGKQMAAWDSKWGSIPIGPAESYQLGALKLGELYLERKYGRARSSLRFASLVDKPIQGAHYSGY
ncbi:MAG: hypothetical protein ACOYM3_02740 [Terrimicrobiaceae bacterium]